MHVERERRAAADRRALSALHQRVPAVGSLEGLDEAVGYRIRGVAQARQVEATRQCLGQRRGSTGQGSGWHDARGCASAALPPT